jgi:hypothetical protein
VDLDVGFAPSEWPRRFVEHALHVVIDGLEGRSIATRLPPGARLELRRSDTDRRWQFGEAGDLTVVRGEPWALLAWLLGRLARDSAALDVDGVSLTLLPWA